MRRAYSQGMTSCGAHLLRDSPCLERPCTTILASGGRARSLRYFCVLSFPYRFSCTFTGSGYDLLASVRNITKKWAFLVGMMSWIHFLSSLMNSTHYISHVYQLYNVQSTLYCNRIIVLTHTCQLQ